jgi:hypothetical protein
VTSLEEFQKSRRVIEDFTSRSLAAIPTDFGRLCYINSLKEGPTGRYRHDGLAALYSEDSVQQALVHCHEELFSKILETPLYAQEGDLRGCLGRGGKNIDAIAKMWEKEQPYRAICPEGLPKYLSDLFSSNVSVLLSVFLAGTATSGPTSSPRPPRDQ